MKKYILKSFLFLAIMVILTGLVYPLTMTIIAGVLFPSRANGSVLKTNDKIIGSELIGQKFDTPEYFWSRPSVSDYNTIPSSASNYGPTSDTLKKLVDFRRKYFAESNEIKDFSVVPSEMVFASGSGLDPHISPEAAFLQVKRIAGARKFNDAQKNELTELIKRKIEKPQFLIFGEYRINVLKLNLELDKMNNNADKHF